MVYLRGAEGMDVDDVLSISRRRSPEASRTGVVLTPSPDRKRISSGTSTVGLTNGPGDDVRPLGYCCQLGHVFDPT